MSKPRQGPALFDLLPDRPESQAHPVMRTHGVIRIPSWWPEGDPQQDPPVSPAPWSANPDPDAEGAAVAARDRVISLHHRRLRISLTSYAAALTVFGVLVVITAFYDLGRRSGVNRGIQLGYEQARADAEPVDDLQAVRLSAPDRRLLAGLTEPSASPLPPAKTTATFQAEPLAAPGKMTGPGKWLRDHTYVVAQEYAPAKAGDAPAGQSFLAQHGIETVIMPQKGGGSLLLTTQGYWHKDPLQKRQSDQLLEKVKAVGQAYYAKGGGYKLEGYFKTLKSDRW